MPRGERLGPHLSKIGNEREYTLAREVRVEVSLAQVAHCLPRFARRAPDMREEHNIVHEHQFRWNVGFVGKDIESRALDHTCLERRDQRRLVDDRATGYVDECPLFSQSREYPGIDDVARRVA